jgi:hypothetical protein
MEAEQGSEEELKYKIDRMLKKKANDKSCRLKERSRAKDKVKRMTRPNQDQNRERKKWTSKVVTFWSLLLSKVWLVTKS